MDSDLIGPLIQKMAWNNDDIDGGYIGGWRDPMRRKVAIGLGHELSQGGLEFILESDIG